MKPKNRNPIPPFPILFSAILSVVFAMASPLNPFAGGDSATDSSAFKYIAFLMDQGYMPYRDTFDHKGPLIYVINWLGMKVSFYSGVWVFEVIALFFTFFFLYRIARLCAGRVFSCVCVLCCASLLFVYFEGGNFVEEYAMPFIAASLFLFLDYMKNRTISAFRLIACGFSFGCVYLLRLNMTAVWIVFAAVIFFHSLIKKEYSRLIPFVLYFLAGFAACLLPFIIWLGARGALAAFWESYILFNFTYTSGSVAQDAYAARIHAFLTFTGPTVTLIALILNCYLAVQSGRDNLLSLIQSGKDASPRLANSLNTPHNPTRSGKETSKNDALLYGTHLAFFLCTLLFTCMSGMQYGHYGMVIIPAIAFPIASFDSLCRERSREAQPLLTLMASVFLLTAVILPDLMTFTYGLFPIRTKSSTLNRSYLSLAVHDVIMDYTDEDDVISVYGNWDLIYLDTKRLSASKYSYQFPIGTVDPVILEEYFDDLREQQPKVIVIQAGHLDERMHTFLAENGYELVWLPADGDDTSAQVYKSSAW